jgi:choice-of-anchor B domain-containing protein
MKKYSFFISLLFISYLSLAQFNLSMLGKLPYSNAKGALSDVWGYVDTTGKEYAIVGLKNGVSIVDVSNPSNPVEVFWTAGASTIWRDIKTWNKHAYITNEGNNGLMIIDLSSLPNTGGITVLNYTGNLYPFTKAHNIYIDENGVAYIAGANYGVGGAIMLDLTQNPKAPVEMGIFNTYYLHDAFTRGDTLWGSAVNDGFLVVVDVTNKANPIIKASQVTPNSFTHNAWLSNNGKYIYTTDEKSSAFLTGYDVSNLNNIAETDRAQSNPGSLVIPHNTHFINNYLVTSYYRDGVTIHDVQYPDNIIEVGNYDTSPLYVGNGFNGCWGAYPWLPSGNILASDIEEGLYILAPTYTRACYLEGLVTDFGTAQPINGVQVEILNTPPLLTSTNTNVLGNYKTGYAIAGQYSIAFNKTGYFPDTISVNLSNGIVTTLNVQLKSMTPYTFTGLVKEMGTNIPIENAVVLIKNKFTTYTDTTDSNGNFSIANMYDDFYEVYCYHWGHHTYCDNNVSIQSNPGNMTIELQKGYYDDFSFDMGWTSTATALTGFWERAIPKGTTFNSFKSNPDADVTNDCLDLAFVTGNSGTQAGDDDVDDGNVILTSPVFNLSTYTEPYISYHHWFFNMGQFSLGDDSISFYLSNGNTTILIETVKPSLFAMSKWEYSYRKISDYITPTANMQFIINTGDKGTQQILEAGLDKFMVTEGPSGMDKEFITEDKIKIFPNPFNNSFSVISILENENVNVEIFDISGKVVLKEIYTSKEKTITIAPNLNSGLYFVKINNEVFKLIKQ